MKPLKSCVNGCHTPPKPPSLVICEDCIAKITRTLEETLERIAGRAVDSVGE